MSVQKGYPSKERDLSLGASDIHMTGEPIREKQHGLSVLSHMFVREVGTDAVEALSTTTVINATAHSAKVGDVIRFTSGALSGQEVKVRAVATNTITLAETLASAPAAAVSFQILRHKYPVVDADGNLTLSVGAVDVDLDEATDTVQVYGYDGAVNRAIKTDAAGELQIDVLSSALPSGASTLAEQQAQSALLTTIDADTSALAGTVSGTELQVDIVSAPIITVQATDLDIRDLSSATDSVTVVATDLDIRDLSSATDSVTVLATNLDIRDLTSVSDSVSAVQSGTWNINNISGTISLPTGAATEATLASVDTSLNNIESDVDNIRIAVEALETAQNLDVVQFARLEYSSTNVTTAAYVELIASTTALTKKLQIFDSSGQTLYLALGAAASEVDKLIIVPGGNGDIQVSIPASTRISLKAISATANTGEIVVNLLG